MATRMRLQAVLRRQLQTALHPSLIKQPISAHSILSHQSPIEHLTWNRQQQRYQSDRFRPRAITAFKSKKDSASDNTKVANDDNVLCNQKQTDLVENNNKHGDEVSSTAPSVASDAASLKNDPMPDTPPTFSAAHAPSNAASSGSAPSYLDNEVDNRPKDDQASSVNTVDSNPWAHMHLHEFAPKIVVIGVGGAGTNAVNNMVSSGLAGEPKKYESL